VPYSPLHDGAVVIQRGRISHAGCILPLTLREDLPEGVGTRHRAAVGITEETDAVVIVVSEETASISAVMGGDMVRGLDAARLRVVMRDAMSGSRKLHAPDDSATVTPGLGPGNDGAARADAEPVAPEGKPAATQRTNQGRQVRSAG